MVEPQYMDQKHNEAEKRAAGCTGKSKQKRAHGVPEANNGPAWKHVHSLDEDAGPSAQDGSQIQSVQPVDRMADARADKLIVKEEHHVTYEAAAMETYINAWE
jgi:hypothetical protein